MCIDHFSGVIRDRIEPATKFGMSAMPPKAEVHWGCGRDRLHADAAVGVSYRDAIGTNTMAETVPIGCPSVTKSVSRPRSRKFAIVSASTPALHLDCTRAYIGKLEAEGVIQRLGDGFPLDQNRVAYLRHLRRE